MLRRARAEIMEGSHGDVLREKASHYLSILSGEKKPNYKIARSVPFDDGVNVKEIELDQAWKLHENAHQLFLQKDSIDDKEEFPDYRNYLELKAAIAERLLEECNFCECNCGANRTAGEKGKCLVGSKSHASSWFLHRGEESVLVPSGTIFFSGCNFKCVFCQNHDISTNQAAGMEVTPQKLVNISRELSKDGARNINYVGGDPIPNTHVIIKSLICQDIDTPQLWNSNFFNSMHTLKLLSDIIDVWLPDFKYGNIECGKRLSGVDQYFDVLKRNLKYVHDEMVVKGKATLIIRHLVMPNHVECCSIPILEWISENLPLSMINIMGQYRPQHQVNRHPEKFKEITRRPSREEMNEVRNRSDKLGVAWRDVSF